MAHWLNQVSSYSVAIASIIGLVKYKRIPMVYKPFVYLLWIGLIVEILCDYAAKVYHNNLVVGNLYVLVESLFLLWQFARWNNAKAKETARFFIWIGLLFIGAWFFDNVIVHRISRLNSAFRIAYSIVIVFLSIEQINTEFILEKGNILKNATFLLCAAFISFFAFKAIFEVFYMIEVRMSNDFYHVLNLLNVIFNLIANLIFALAVLWMPKKQKYLLP